MKIIWTREAINNLIEIEDFISQNNPERAVEFIDYLVEQTKYLKSTPNMGRVVPEISNPDIRELIVKNYRIVYRLIDGEIQIVTVFESHRRLPIDL